MLTDRDCTANAGTLEDDVLTMPDGEVIIFPNFISSNECLFDQSTGTLTLRGNVSVTDVWQYTEQTKKVVVAESGCVLPESCAYLFANFTSVTSIDLTRAYTGNVKSMWQMFYNCYELTELNLGDFDTSCVENMGEMLSECQALESLDVSGFDTGNCSVWMEMRIRLKAL